MISPSSSSTSRSTPCVLGCWGPMLTVIVSLRSSATSVRPPHAIALEVRSELLFTDFERLVGFCRLANLHRIVLALWMALPVVGHQQAPEIGMIGKHDAEHVPHFALEPAGRRPHALNRWNGVVRGGSNLQAEAQAVRNREQVVDDLKAWIAREIVGRGHLDEHVEPQRRRVTKSTGGLDQP